MSEDEISRYASDGRMPEEITYLESCLYYELRDIYTAHREGRITRIQGEQRKKEAIGRFREEGDKIKWSLKYLQFNVKMWKDIELAGSKYRNDPSIENADEFMEAVYRVKRKREGNG